MKLTIAISALSLLLLSAACGDLSDAQRREAERRNNNGLELAEEGRWEEAVEEFGLAIRLDPEATDAYYNRAIAHLTLGEYEGAAADFDSAISAGATHIDAYLKLGIAYVQLGDYEHAAAALDRAIDVDPSPAEAYAHRITVHILLGRLDAAIMDLRKYRSLTGPGP